MKFRSFIIALSSILLLSGCTEAELASHVFKNMSGSPAKTVGYFKVGKPYKIQGRYYTPAEDYNLVETGVASWYGPGFHGKMTANGETFDENELTAAHRTLQMPSIIRVTNLDNGRAIIMRVNDRGPFSRGRILDVSKRGAELLGFKKAGTAKIKIQVLEQESRHVAQLAKSGRSTNGVEVALNQNSKKVVPRKQQPAINAPNNTNQQYASRGTLTAADMTNAPTPATTPQKIYREDLLPPMNQQNIKVNNVDGHYKGGNFLPDQTVQRLPLAPPKGVFVQAGSFSNPTNATAFAKTLSRYGNANVSPIDIGGRTLYRVRIPASSTRDADLILSHLASQGNPDAIIVVE